MPFVEDFTAFLSVSEFASNATLSGVAVVGVFDKAYQFGNVGGNGMASTSPVFTLPTASVPANPVSRALVVDAVTYAITAHEPDGTGMSTLMLERTT